MKRWLMATLLCTALAAFSVTSAEAAFYPTFPLVNHGGYLENYGSSIYLVFWGDWNFTDNGYPTPHTGAQTKTFITNFAKAWGGSALNNVVTQYGVANTSTANATYTWDDQTNYPCGPGYCPLTTSQIHQEAIRAAEHFGGCLAPPPPTRCRWTALRNIVVVLTPYQAISGGYDGFHTWSEPIQINGDARLDGVADAWVKYYSNWNAYSLITAHELAEVETDPAPGPHPAWYDESPSNLEVTDKCDGEGSGETAFYGTFSDGNQYWVPKLWSNASMSCVMSY